MTDIIQQLEMELRGRLISALRSLIRDCDAARGTPLTIRDIAILRGALKPKVGRPRSRIRCPRCGRVLRGLIPKGAVYTRPNIRGFCRTATADLIPWHNDASTGKRPDGPQRGKDRKRRCLAVYQPYGWVATMQSMTSQRKGSE